MYAKTKEKMDLIVKYLDERPNASYYEIRDVLGIPVETSRRILKNYGFVKRDNRRKKR